MVPDDWEQIKQAFSGALGVSADARDAYVLRACGDRPDLLEEVQKLLAAHREASTNFLEPGCLLFDAPWLFRAGDRVANRFEIIRAIARGAMGEVYEARDDRLQLRVALKALRPQLVGDAQTAERFRREVLVTRDIAHDNLCRIFDLIEHPVGPGSGLKEGTTIPCLTMQLLEGQSLEEYLKTHRPLKSDDALQLLRQIAAALDVLHARGVVHRDLKPSNVVLVQRGNERRAILTDFGLAKPLDESLFETQAAVQGGAPFFMAPELFRGARPSRASDIYAFGLLIDEMVTSQRAFSADALHGLMLQKLHERPARPSERGAVVERSWDQTVLRCLAQDPEERFISAEEVCRSLEGKSATPPRRRLRALIRRRAGGWRAAAIGASAVLGLSSLVIVNGGAVIADSDFSASVVVLPFDNLTGDKANDYLATGTTVELGRRLNRLPGLMVYAPRSLTVPEDPSRQATYSLKGYVQQAGPTLRITVQLGHQKRNVLVWSQSYEGRRDEALRLEERLAEESAVALSRESVRDRESSLGRLVSWWRFLRSAAPNVPTPGTSNNQAFDLYMRGRYLFEQRTLPEALAAMDLLTKATELDPAYAAPFALLADLQQVFMDLHYRPHEELVRLAEGYAERAVQLDPNLPDAQVSLASIRQIQSRWDEAESGFRKALNLHPAFARAHRWYSGMLLQFGKHDEALRLAQHAIDLDPYDASSQQFLGLALFYSDRPEEAAQQLERLLARGDLLHARMILGQVYAYLASRPGPTRADYVLKALEQSTTVRRMELAAAAALPAATGPPRTEFADFVGALAWAGGDDEQAARPFIERLEAERAAGRVSPSILARVYAAQRRADDALQALEDSAAQHDRELMYLSVSPWYRHIRHLPRFEALRKRMRLIG